MGEKIFSISLMLIVCFVLFVSTGVAATQPNNVLWTQNYGGTKDDGAYSIVETPDGGYAIAGSTESFGNGGFDSWLIKVDAFGNIEWNQTYGGINNDQTFSLVNTPDEGFALAGSTDSFDAGNFDSWLIKVDKFGNEQWNQTYGGEEYDSASCLVITPDGGYALAGATQSFGSGDDDFWFVKTDSVGNMQWNRTYGGFDYDRTFCVINTSDGGFALVGGTGSFGSGKYDCWLVKTDDSGNVQWNKTYGGIYYDRAYSMVETLDGGYMLAGNTGSFGAGAYDVWLLNVDLTGNVQWNKTYGGVDNDFVSCLIRTSDGGYALCGDTRSFGSGEYDFWLVKTDDMGNMQWNQTYGGTGNDRASILLEISDGSYMLAGDTNSFGAGEYDFWFVKTDNSGIPEFSSLIIIILSLLVALLTMSVYKKRLAGSFTGVNHLIVNYYSRGVEMNCC